MLVFSFPLFVEKNPLRRVFLCRNWRLRKCSFLGRRLLDHHVYKLPSDTPMTNLRGELSEVADINIDHHQGSRGIITRERLFRNFEHIEICKERKSSEGGVRPQPLKERAA